MDTASQCATTNGHRSRLFGFVTELRVYTGKDSKLTAIELDSERACFIYNFFFKLMFF